VKCLYLLRHAKSSWDDPGLDDHDRPLARRGERAASAMGRHLATLDVRPDLVLCSSARRAADTFDRIRLEVDPDLVAKTDRRLYLASARELLDRLRAVDDGVGSILLVGHEPSMSQLACALAAPDSSQDWRRLKKKFPTGACAEIRFPLAKWSEIAPGSGSLHRFWRPRDLA
jgi:phosphohistidine phosphatase